ncbi:MAG: PucR family transcriptional regulator [Solirubrobacteraceae bacterium]
MPIDDDMRCLATGLRERIPSIASDIRKRLVVDVPEYYEGGDPALLEADRRSTGSALHALVDGLSHGRTPADRASGLAIEEARLAAQAGIDLWVMLRGYRVAQAVARQAIIEEAERLVDDPERRLAVITLALDFHFEWNERVTAGLVDAYQRERELLFRDRERRKREFVRDLLNGLPVDTSKLAYNLRGEHLGAVAWGASPEEAVTGLAASVGGKAFSVSGTAGAIFGWVGAQGLTAQQRSVKAGFEPPAATFVALGEAALGPDGFRTTHRQALQAYRVAYVRRQPLTLYRDVALEALVMRDLQLVRDFVAYELGPIAGDDHRDSILRATLDAYFQTGQNASSAAHLLGVHERTVSYRLRSVEQRLGVPVSSRRDQLAVALRLLALLKGEILDAEVGEPAAV